MWHNEMLVTSQVDDKSGKHLVWKHFVVATLTLQLAEPMGRYGNESKERSFLKKVIKPTQSSIKKWLQSATIGVKLLTSNGAHICASFLNKICDCLITFLLFVRWQRLIARNVHELFISNRGISHLNEAYCIDDLSRGSILGPDILINN